MNGVSAELKGAGGKVGNGLLSRKAFGVVLACRNRALLGPLRLVRQHMGAEVLKDLAAIGVRAPLLLLRLIVAVVLITRVARIERGETSAPLLMRLLIECGRLERRKGLETVVRHEG